MDGLTFILALTALIWTIGQEARIQIMCAQCPFNPFRKKNDSNMQKVRQVLPLQEERKAKEVSLPNRSLVE